MIYISNINYKKHRFKNYFSNKRNQLTTYQNLKEPNSQRHKTCCLWTFRIRKGSQSVNNVTAKHNQDFKDLHFKND